MFIARAPNASTQATGSLFHDELPPLRASEWKYIAEGGANVVFSYASAGQSTFQGCVLRVRKADVWGATPTEIVAFANRHLPCGSKEGYVQVARAIVVTREFLVELNDHFLASTRPSHRQDTELDTSMLQVLLLPDMSRESSVCLEIKPKAGVLPGARNVHQIKKSVCRFCMHQRLKHAEGKVSDLSQYCPLALFSKDKRRVSHAIQSLHRTPQNNFRVLSHLPPTASHLEVLPQLLHSLSSVLEDLKAMHAKDHLDIEGVWALSQLIDLMPDTINNATNLGTWLASLSANLRCEINSAMDHAVLAGLTKSPWTNLTIDEFRALYNLILEEFHVATTYKDCSLLITICHGAAEETKWTPFEHTIEYANERYRCVVAIVDIDIKTHKQIESYYKLDQAILTHARDLAWQPCQDRGINR
ncbi:unnamed protein product [Aphanomyces euteiches]|nr:hypothetical protein AeRB84_002297 [Aphanomyces euteiches]